MGFRYPLARLPASMDQYRVPAVGPLDVGCRWTVNIRHRRGTLVSGHDAMDGSPQAVYLWQYTIAAVS